MNGWSAGSSSKITAYTVGSWNGTACYCIEPGTPLNIGDVMTARDENYWDNYPSAYNKTISADEIKLFIGRIFQYGYTGTITTEWKSQNAADADKMAHMMATQTLIWETVVGERDSNFSHVDTGSYDAVNDRIAKNHPLYNQLQRLHVHNNLPKDQRHFVYRMQRHVVLLFLMLNEYAHIHSMALLKVRKDMPLLNLILLRMVICANHQFP